MRKTKKKRRVKTVQLFSIFSMLIASLNGFSKRLNAQCVGQTLKMKLILLKRFQEMMKKKNKMKKDNKTFQEKLKN